MSLLNASRRIFLGMPGYGKQTSAAGRAFWCACADVSSVIHTYQFGSLLACNFNSLWCEALTMVHQGAKIDYFAMLHDDVGPEDLWLDKLIAELDARELDVLGVAVPIKDQRGVTSLAAAQEGDNWRQRRLTMHEVYKLPETFTSDDLGAPLLLNTGCWVCKFDMRWATQVHFTINDRIVFNRQANAYQAQTEPEDWFFSRLLHEQDLKIGATRKIRLAHRGDNDFPNTSPWGTNKTDIEAAATTDIILETDKKDEAYPSDVHGWLHPTEGAELAKLAQCKTVLEIGSYCGLSTICMAKTAAHVTAVDYFDGRDTPEPADTRKIFEDAIKRHRVEHKIAVCDPDAVPPLAEYDFLFIDGSHHYESVKRDIEKWRHFLKADGLIAFHDYDSKTDPGVYKAVDEYLASGAKLISTHKSLAVVKPPAAIPLEV